MKDYFKSWGVAIVIASIACVGSYLTFKDNDETSFIISTDVTQKHVEDYDVHAQFFDGETTIRFNNGELVDSQMIVRTIGINGISYYMTKDFRGFWHLGPKVEE